MIKFSKIFGWILLFSGLLIISYSLYSSYQIFTGKKNVPQIFVAEGAFREGIEIPFPGQEVEIPIPQQLQKILTSGFLSPKILNLMSWAMWASILIFAGSRISSLGIKLIK